MIRSTCFALTLALLLCAQAHAASSLIVTDVGRVTFTDSSVSELSGLTFVKDDPDGQLFYAVSDAAPLLVPLTIDIHSASGAVQSVSVGSAITMRTADGVALPNNIDQEGVAYHAASGTVWIANESEPGLRRHDLSTGNTIQHITPASHPQLNVFANAVNNRKFESLTIQGNGQAMWTANEEALSGDPTDFVRLQKFDAAFNPAGQYAYQIDAAPGSASFNGVVDMVALPNGSLIVMERMFDSFYFHIRLYEVDFAGATNLAGGSMAGATPVTKHHLWDKTFLFSSIDNFEGIALGPKLDNGDYSLLLIADNNAGQIATDTHALYALRLTIPEPASLSLLAVGSLMLMRRKRN